MSADVNTQSLSKQTLCLLFCWGFTGDPLIHDIIHWLVFLFKYISINVWSRKERDGAFTSYLLRAKPISYTITLNPQTIKILLFPLNKWSLRKLLKLIKFAQLISNWPQIQTPCVLISQSTWHLSILQPKSVFTFLQSQSSVDMESLLHRPRQPVKGRASTQQESKREIEVEIPYEEELIDQLSISFIPKMHHNLFVCSCETS